MSSQAQIQAAEKFKAPEASSVAGKEVDQEAVVADADEPDDEEVRGVSGAPDGSSEIWSVIHFPTISWK